MFSIDQHSVSLSKEGLSIETIIKVSDVRVNRYKNNYIFQLSERSFL